jgi:probable phosphoglycerate mutase
MVIIMKILFVRHGDPDYVNDYLTEKGFREAQLLADCLEKLTVRDFYCSTLGRARATAKVTLDRIGREAVIYDWLREFPGQIIDDQTNKPRIPWDFMPGVWTKHPMLYDKEEWLKDPIMQTGNVEEVYRNIVKNFDELLARYGYVREGGYYRVKQGNTDTIVIFCHLGVEFVILSHLLGISASVLWQGFFVAPTSITTVSTEERVKGEASFRVQALGDTSHLYVGNEPISYSGFFCETYE